MIFETFFLVVRLVNESKSGERECLNLKSSNLKKSLTFIQMISQEFLILI